MSYLTTEEFESILDTVTIFPVTSVELGDISQYSFDCGDAEEYVTFLRNKAIDLDKLAVTKTFVIIHNETKELTRILNTIQILRNFIKRMVLS